MNDSIDLGGDFAFTPRYIDGELHGFVFDHPRPDGSLCELSLGWIPVGTNGWQLHSLEPLTLSPSLLCKVCGTHGFVRDGKWVPA